MLELGSSRKQKINLHEYPFKQDIEIRFVLSESCPLEIQVIEEILFSPLKISIKKLSRSTEIEEEKLLPLLKKLSLTKLLEIQEDQILVDKEIRKQFEFEISRFDASFKPDLEFIQGILKKVPIHLLPIWYAIPRTSNNIFESIIEKYLLTPQLFQRYLSDLHFPDPLIDQISKELFYHPQRKLYSSEIISKHNLTREKFEEIVLLLEFHFVGFLSYEKEEDHWLEVITPFYEWQRYLQFLEETEVTPIEPTKVLASFTTEFAFIKEIDRLLLKAQNGKDSIDPKESLLTKRALEKIELLQMGRFDGNTNSLFLLESHKQWLDRNMEEKALFLYRHPLNLLSLGGNERLIREAEKSIRRVLHGKWVGFDAFFEGTIVSLKEGSQVMIQKVGKQYRYAIPTYGEKEKEWLKKIVFDWLFETGMVTLGTYEEEGTLKDCFMVTSLGRFCFQE